MSDVSVIIVNFNAGPLLKQAAQSVLLSEAVSKVIIVDNKSTDQSISKIEHLCLLQLRLTCIRNKENIGFAKACNIGVEAADNCEYLLFLNPDCLMKGNSLETLLTFMKSSPETGMAGPLLFNPDGTEQLGGRRAIPTPWRSFVRAFGLSKLGERYPRLFSDFLLHQQPLPDGPVEVEAISGSCMLVRREALFDVGLLDEGYFMHCEDLDWCMRFRQKGWKITFVPDARVEHHQGTCSKARPVFVEWHKHKGMMRFYRKFFRNQYPGVLMWIVALGVWLRFGVLAIWYSIRKAGSIMGIGRE